MAVGIHHFFFLYGTVDLFFVSCDYRSAETGGGGKVGARSRPGAKAPLTTEVVAAGSRLLRRGRRVGLEQGFPVEGGM